MAAHNSQEPHPLYQSVGLWRPEQLENTTDPVDLAKQWFNLRRVSRSCAAEIEKVFLEKHLSSLSIYLPIEHCLIEETVVDDNDNDDDDDDDDDDGNGDDGNDDDDIDYKDKSEDEKCTYLKPEMRCPCTWPDTLRRDPEVMDWLSIYSGMESYFEKFTFQKLSPQDPDVAIFECRYPGIPGPRTAVPMKIIAALASQDLAVGPHHGLTLFGGSIRNDTALPGFSVNVDEVTISFRWKDMFTRLLGEELVRGNILRKMILDNPTLPRSFLDLPPALLDPGTPEFIAQGYTGPDLKDYPGSLLNKFNDLFIDSALLARQTRLRRALQQLEGREIDTTSVLFQRQENRALRGLYGCFWSGPSVYYGPERVTFGWP
ncbi:MAG: hypothetical protein Q9179_001163 [Wetmoreana sp. 5 TL-2023]